MLKRLLTICLLLALILLPGAIALADDGEDTDDDAKPAQVDKETDTAEATEEPDPVDDALMPFSTELVYDVMVTGTITDEAFTQDWTLEASGSDRVTVRVERTDGNLIPDVNVFDVTGRQIARSSGADRSGAVAFINRADLSANVYTVQVSRERGEGGVTSGSYSLVVSPLATGDDHPNNTTPVGEIEYGEAVTGEITNEHWYHTYTLDVEAADYIRVTANRLSGTLMPEVQVISPEGRALRTGNVNDRGNSATLEFQLPDAGQYTVVMTRARGFSGFTQGEYELTVTLWGAGTGSSVLAGTAGTVDYGEPVTGSIGARWYEDWQLVTQSGDTLTIIVERAPGATLMPEVFLLGGSLQEMRRGSNDDTGAGARIERYSLSVPGTYFIRVSRVRGQNGATDGDYTLTVQLDGIGAGNSILAESVGTVELNTPVEGTITNAQWANVWMYTAEAGEQINLTATRNDGTLIPNIDIQDINGQSLRTIRADNSGDIAQMTNYRFPNAGQYRIVVLRADQQNGYTSGDYNLLVEPFE